MIALAYEIATTPEFEVWFDGLTPDERRRIASKIDMLEERGPTLRHPASSDIHGSRHGGMRELRIQVGGAPYRILYAFDPLRRAVLLLGGNKVGDEKRWYKENVPRAEALFDRHLEAMAPVKKPGKGTKKGGRNG